MKNKIQDLRNHLFAQLEKLQDDEIDLNLEVQRANAMIGISSQIIDTAKVEFQMARLLVEQGNVIESEFFDIHEKDNKLLNR